MQAAPAPQPYIELPGEQGSLTWLKKRIELDVTGADAAAAVGCSQYESAENLRRSKLAEREKSDEQLLIESQSFAENVHTRAGHVNEDPIAVAACRLLFPGNDERLVLHQPRLARPSDAVSAWFGASADRLLVRRTVNRELLAIFECKFSFDGVPEHPMVEHIFQCQMQMRTIQTRHDYLCYGSRFPGDGPLPVGWKPNYHDPRDGVLGVRVFRLRYSQELWHWTLTRLGVYRAALADPRAASLDETLPTMHDFVEHVWFESPECRTKPCEEKCVEFFHQQHAAQLARVPLSQYLPPAPQWELLIPEASSRRKWMMA